jgi:type IV pilus secretin PilQ/predicted competence protein
LGVVLGGLSLCGAFALLLGCAPPPAPLDEAAVAEEAVVNETSTGGGAAVPADANGAGGADGAEAALEVRELKVIDDNGQQGVFAKLSRAPREVSYFTLANPNRLVVEVLGTTSGIFAEQYPVENPVIEQVRVGADENKIRLTIALRGDTFPTYTVDDLNDTIVAFLGEPQGSSEPVREQIVFTQRALPGAEAGTEVAAAGAPPPAPRPAPAPAPAARAPSSPVLVGSGPDVRQQDPPRAAVETLEDAPPPSARKLYYGQPISLDLKDADVHNVLRLIAEVSNLNIVATDDVTGQITLRLFDVPWDQALDIILQVMNLESVQEGNVLRISTVKRLREEREELARAQEAAQIVEPLQVAYLRVNYAKARKLAELVSGAARTEGAGGRRTGTAVEEGVLTSRGSVLVDEFTNTLIVRDIARGIRNARELVQRLDVQIPQVLIESNIVEATTDFARDLGIQWGYQRSVGPQTGTSTGVNFPGTVDFAGSGLNTGSGGTPFMVDFPAGGNFAPGSGTALDLALGSLDGSRQLDLRLTALEQKGKGRIISRPRVVTLNNVAATIKSLTILRVRLPSTGTVISTGAGGQAGSAQSATEKIETGIILTVTPQVSSDGFVLLDLFAKSSQADFTRTVDNIPTEITREATSHVLVRDGQTVVLGGIYRDTTSDNVSGVPFFDSIPGLRWLFRNQSKSKRREDLLVFLTPRVITAVQAGASLPSAAELWQNRNGEGEG